MAVADSVAVNPLTQEILVSGSTSKGGNEIGILNPNTLKLKNLFGKNTTTTYTGVLVDPNSGNYYATAENAATLKDGVWRVFGGDG